jgi:hypothetical protein
MRPIIKTFIVIVLLAATQYGYDKTKPVAATGIAGSLSPGFIRMIDMGFDPAVASFMWVGTMPEIVDLFNDKTEYLSDQSFLSTVDPKLAYPYAFSVLTLPVFNTFPAAVVDAQAIGEEGLKQADPDWRIPYYMAINYFLELKDPKDALEYFDRAAETPGVPEYAKRFAENFGSGENVREKTKELWATIRDTTNDPVEKARAQAYINRLDIFDYLEAAAKSYQQKFGVYPTSTQMLVARGIIPEVPQDPFGYTFIFGKDGTAQIDLTKPPVVNNP